MTPCAQWKARFKMIASASFKGETTKARYMIRIGTLETVVTIRLRRTWGSRTAYRLSHAIKTPRQPSPFWSCASEADTPGDALRKAISGFTMHYRKAVGEGYAPAEDWLVPAGS